MGQRVRFVHQKLTLLRPMMCPLQLATLVVPVLARMAALWMPQFLQPAKLSQFASPRVKLTTLTPMQNSIVPWHARVNLLKMMDVVLLPTLTALLEPPASVVSCATWVREFALLARLSPLCELCS